MQEWFDNLLLWILDAWDTVWGTNDDDRPRGPPSQ